MTAPTYQERTADEIATDNRPDGTRIKVIAGETSQGQLAVLGSGV